MNDNKSRTLDTTLDLLSALIEVAAIARSSVATWHVVSAVTNGDTAFTLFTVATIEGVFLVSLFSLHRKATAPITALAALVFAGVMQLMELRLLTGEITAAEKDVLRAVVAFAPIAILGIAYLQHLTQVPSDGSRLLDAVRGIAASIRPPKVIDGTAAPVQLQQPNEAKSFLAQPPRPADVGRRRSTETKRQKEWEQTQRTPNVTRHPGWRECSECHKQFETWNAKRVTCSNKCRQARWRRKRKAR